MLRNTRLRRSVATVLAVAGAVLLLLAPRNAWLGAVLLVAGVALEVVGLNLRHPDGESR